MPIKTACIFCGGEYVKLIKPVGMENYEVVTVFLNEIGGDKMMIPLTVAYRCSTCGNIQTFVEEELEV